MNDNAVFQFVGFETALVLDKFILQWENFARRFFKKDIHKITLQQQVATRNRYKYVSKNEWPKDDFRFVFMEGRMSDHFPDHAVKVVQTGGYIPVQLECADNPAIDEIKILTFIAEENPDLAIYRNLPHRNLNIYQAYYQNCLYAWILEYYVMEESEAAGLVAQLKKLSHHLEVGMYKESMVLEG